MSGAMPSCPICGKPVDARPANPSSPFCSDRCRLLDLGRWLGEEYRIPGPLAGDGGARTPPAEEDAAGRGGRGGSSPLDRPPDEDGT